MKTFFRFLISKALWVNILIALLLVTGSVYATMSYLKRFTMHGKTVEVPALKDSYITDIDYKILEDDFSLVITDSVYEKNQEGGFIIEQNPVAGFKVKPGRKIYLTISAYTPPEVSMPNLVDLSLRQAMSLLTTSGLELGKLIYKPDICSNCVLEQLVEGKAIKEGQLITKGNTVDLVIGEGLGNELVPVPYLIEFTAEMAEELLKVQYLNVGSLIYDQTVKTEEDSMNAKVYRQIPHYTEEPVIHLGGTVELYLTIDTNLIIHSVIPTDTLDLEGVDIDDTLE